MRLFSRRVGDLERRAGQAFVRQLDESDCGAACLAWIVRFFGGAEPLERLRRLTGTTAEGTTLLGLHRAAGEIGLTPEAYEARIADLWKLESPAILHVRLPGNRQHFVVCFGQADSTFVIGDPGTGLTRLTDAQVDDIWKSKALLLLRPGRNFLDRKCKATAKRRWLFDAVRVDAKVLLLSALMGAVISLFGLALALFSKVLIDDILPNRATLKLGAGLLLLFLVLTAQAGLTAARWLLILRQARAFNIRITNRFLGDLLRLPFPFFCTRKTGDLMARLNDTARVQHAVTHVLGGIVIDLLVLCVGLGFIFIYSPAITLAIGVLLASFLVVAWRFHRPIVEGQRRVMSARSVNKSGYVEAIRGIETIKPTNAERLFTSLMKDTYVRLQDETFRLAKIGVACSAAVEMTGTVLLVGVLAWSSLLVLDGALEVGALVAILQMTGMVVPSVRSLATANIELQEAVVAFDRMYQLTSLRPEYREDDQAEKSIVKGVRRLDVDGLLFRHVGRPPLLDGVAFGCRAGELLLITGRTGSGKSTLLQILQRLLVPESGRVRVNGCDWDDLSIRSWRDVLGVMPQHVQIFSGTLLDNIQLGLSVDPIQILETCGRLGFHTYFQELPGGYATVLGEGGTALSGGQRQLVGLARALVREAPVLLLDEPTASMDADTALFAMDVVDRCRDDRIVIVASHAMTFTSRADRVYRIEDGRMTTMRCDAYPEAAPSPNARGSNAPLELTSRPE